MNLSPYRTAAATIVACLVLLLAACGTGDAGTTQVAGATIVAPTAVPTTPPLALPPADDSLPALAQLPAVVDAQAASTAPVSIEPATVDPVAVDPATSDPITSAPVVVAPTPVPPAAVAESAQAAPVSASATEVQPATAVTAYADSTGRWSQCVVEASQAAGAVELLDPIAAGATTDLSSVQLNLLASTAAGCDVVTTGLAGTDLVDHVETAASCLNAWLGSSAGGSVFVGLASTEMNQATPAWAQAQFVDALDACFVGASFAADVMSEVALNPSLAGAFSSDCLAASFESSGTLRAYAGQLASQPTSASLYFTLSDAWVLDCANIGQMVAAAASAEGVALAPGSIACIDAELRNSGLVSQLINGTADTDLVGLATLACLTSAEAAALFG